MKYLPSLIDNHNVGAVSAHGVYKSGPDKVLSDVSQAIRTTDSDVNRNLSSIPDVWARPIYFYNVLKDPGHPHFRTIFNEWKGLISLIVLREVYTNGGKIRFKKIDLNRRNEGDSTLHRSLRVSVPDPEGIRLESSVAYRWEESTILVSFHDNRNTTQQIIGSFSPRTLVYTGSHKPAGNFVTDFRMFLNEQDNMLCEPDINSEQGFNLNIALYVWLKHFVERSRLTVVQSSAQVTKDIQQTINNRFELWRNELEEKVLEKCRELGRDLEKEEKRYEIGPLEASGELVAELNLASFSVFKAILTPVIQRSAEGQVVVSDIFLHSKYRNRGKRVIVFTEETLGRGQRVYRNIYAENSIDAAKQKLAQDFYAAIGVEIVPQEPLMPAGTIEWIRPDLLFLSDVLIIVGNEGDEQVTWPFKKEIFDYFSITHIKNDLQPTTIKIDNNNYEFRFRLELENEDKITISRRYSTSSSEKYKLVRIRKPNIAIFPWNVPNWRKHYFYQQPEQDYFFNSNDNTGPLKFTPLVFDRDKSKIKSVRPITVDDLRISGDENTFVFGEDEIVSLESERIEENNSIDGQLNRLKIRTTELTGNGSCPNIIQITYNRKDSGLYVLDFPPATTGEYGRYSVGLDFGTSNTNLYIGKIDPNDESKVVKPEMLSINLFGENTEPNSNFFCLPFIKGPVVNDLVKLYAGALKIELPIPTALYVVSESINSRNVTPFLDCFLPANQETNVYTNLKWSTSSEAYKAKTRGYISLLLFLTTLVLLRKHAGEVRLKITYPRSFSPAQVSDYISIMENIIKRNISGNGIMNRQQNYNTWVKTDPANDGFRIAGLIQSKSEGLAASYFFLNLIKFEIKINENTDRIHGDASADALTICMDVGGGTTDISLVSKEKPIFDFSVIMAGNEISEYIRRAPRLRKLLFSKEGVAILDSCKDDNDKFSAALNKLYLTEYKSIMERASEIQSNDDFQRFRVYVLFMFSSIAYYSAAVISGLYEIIENNRDKLSRIVTPDTNSNDIVRTFNMQWKTWLNENYMTQPFFCGNGAKVLNLISGNQFGESNTVYKVLHSCLFYGLKYHNLTGSFVSKTITFKLAQSPRHKSEAAGGVIFAINNQGNMHQNQEQTNEEAHNTLTVDVPNTQTSDQTIDDGNFSDYLIMGEKINVYGEKNEQSFTYSEFINKNTLYTRNNSNITKVDISYLKNLITTLNYILKHFGYPAHMAIPLNENDISRYISDQYTRLANLESGKRNIEPAFILGSKRILQQLRDNLQ